MSGFDNILLGIYIYGVLVAALVSCLMVRCRTQYKELGWKRYYIDVIVFCLLVFILWGGAFYHIGTANLEETINRSSIPIRKNK